MCADHSKQHEHVVNELLWPPIQHMKANTNYTDRVNLAEYIKDDPKSGHNNDDWGFVFDEQEYPNCDRASQEKLVSHIQASCAEQGKLITGHL
jgi:hypothetical protein